MSHQSSKKETGIEKSQLLFACLSKRIVKLSYKTAKLRNKSTFFNILLSSYLFLSDNLVQLINEKSGKE